MSPTPSHLALALALLPIGLLPRAPEPAALTTAVIQGEIIGDCRPDIGPGTPKLQVIPVDTGSPDTEYKALVQANMMASPSTLALSDGTETITLKDLSKYQLEIVYSKSDDIAAPSAKAVLYEVLPKADGTEDKVARLKAIPTTLVHIGLNEVDKGARTLFVMNPDSGADNNFYKSGLLHVFKMVDKAKVPGSAFMTTISVIVE